MPECQRPGCGIPRKVVNITADRFIEGTHRAHACARCKLKFMNHITVHPRGGERSSEFTYKTCNRSLSDTFNPLLHIRVDPVVKDGEMAAAEIFATADWDHRLESPICRLPLGCVWHLDLQEDLGNRIATTGRGASITILHLELLVRVCKTGQDFVAVPALSSSPSVREAALDSEKVERLPSTSIGVASLLTAAVRFVEVVEYFPWRMEGVAGVGVLSLLAEGAGVVPLKLTRPASTEGERRSNGGGGGEIVRGVVGTPGSGKPSTALWHL